MNDLKLPYPPSVNHYWRRVGARTLISRGGRAFRVAVCSILAARGVRPLSGPLMVNIDVFPPDKRRRDIDNCLKSLLDALQHGGAYLDDSQITVLHATKHAPVQDGHVVVAIRQVEDTECHKSQ